MIILSHGKGIPNYAKTYHTLVHFGTPLDRRKYHKGTSTDVTTVLQFKNLLDSIWTGLSPPVTTIQPGNRVYS
jgi:hypothetical protein